MSMRSPVQQKVSEIEPPPAPEEGALDKDRVSSPMPAAMKESHPSSQFARSPLSMRSEQKGTESEPPPAPEEGDSPRRDWQVPQAVPRAVPERHSAGFFNASQSSPAPWGPVQLEVAKNEPPPAPEEGAFDKDGESESMSLTPNPSPSPALKGADAERPRQLKRSVSFSEPETETETHGPSHVQVESPDNSNATQPVMVKSLGGEEEAPESIEPIERPLSNKTPVQGQTGNATVETDASKMYANWQRQQLAEGIILLKRWTQSHASLQLAVSNKKLSEMKFTVNISSSVNLEFAKPEGSKGAKTCTVMAPAASDTEVCELHQVDHHQATKLSMAFNWEPQAVQPEELQKLTAAEQQRRKELATELEQQGITASRMTALEIQDACSRAGIPKFVDVDFMPADISLFKNPNSKDHPAVMWKRPDDFCKGSIQVFSNDILPSDIKQGALGDCWFLAALAAMAEDPDLIHRLFGEQGSKVNKHGVYEIKCFKNGRPTSIILDDFLPCSPNTGMPCYAHVDVQGRNANELWVMLLEKAWAKLHGCYERIEAGMPYRALMDLTGSAGKEYHLETEMKPDGLIAKDKFFPMLCKYDQAGYLMVAGTPGKDTFTKGDKSKTPLSGLIPGHAYTLLSAHEVHGVRLLRLRNPWGDHEWTGDWSDKSSLWTRAMKDAVKPSFDSHDGEFWMCEKDFLSHFSGVGVVFFSDSWSTQRTTLSTDGNDMCELISFRTSSPIKKGFLTLFQEDTRIQGAPPYMRLAFALYGPVVNGVPQAEVLRSHLWNARELVEEIPHAKPLPAGEYLVAIFSPEKVTDRSLTLVMQLDVAGHCEVTKQVANDQMRKNLALASALSGPARAIGPTSTRGAWLPNGGYAFAASCTCQSRAVAVSFDFSPCKGLALRGQDSSKVEMVFNSKDSDEMRLIGDLQPVGRTKSFSCSTSYQEVH